MSTESTPSEYMLLFRNSAQWYRELSPDEIQKFTNRWMSWYDRLAAQGKLTVGHPLAYEGKIVSGKTGQFVADGPFAESKEAIGGYFLLSVATIEEAVKIAQDCPGLPYGVTVEVRPIAARCGIRDMAEAELAQAQA
jgi:hypothetical protein